MISLKFDATTAKKAMVRHLEEALGMDMTNKTAEVSFTVGRKTADKPKPDVTVSVNILDEEVAETPVEAPVAEPVAEAETTAPAAEEKPALFGN